jgi:hypothetical protein
MAVSRIDNDRDLVDAYTDKIDILCVLYCGDSDFYVSLIVTFIYIYYASYLL